MQAISPRDDVAFSSTERDRHLGIRPVSQLNTWPVVSPVNASRRPSRDAAHHSGSGRLAKPSPWGTSTSYSLPASWRTPSWVIRVVLTYLQHVRYPARLRPAIAGADHPGRGDGALRSRLFDAFRGQRSSGPLRLQ